MAALQLHARARRTPAIRKTEPALRQRFTPLSHHSSFFARWPF
jgi:hypothetical protein